MAQVEWWLTHESSYLIFFLQFLVVGFFLKAILQKNNGFWLSGAYALMSSALMALAMNIGADHHFSVFSLAAFRQFIVVAFWGLVIQSRAYFWSFILLSAITDLISAAIFAKMNGLFS